LSGAAWYAVRFQSTAPPAWPVGAAGLSAPVVVFFQDAGGEVAFATNAGKLAHDHLVFGAVLVELLPPIGEVANELFELLFV